MENNKPVSIVEVNGKQGVRIRTLDEDFVIDPFIRYPHVTWHRAMYLMNKEGMRGISKNQYAIIQAYHAEISDAIEACGGDFLRDEWSIDGGGELCAVFYNGLRCRVFVHAKEYKCSCRTLLQ